VTTPTPTEPTSFGARVTALAQVHFARPVRVWVDTNATDTTVVVTIFAGTTRTPLGVFELSMTDLSDAAISTQLQGIKP